MDSSSIYVLKDHELNCDIYNILNMSEFTSYSRGFLEERFSLWLFILQDMGVSKILENIKLIFMLFMRFMIAFQNAPNFELSSQYTKRSSFENIQN